MSTLYSGQKMRLPALRVPVPLPHLLPMLTTRHRLHHLLVPVKTLTVKKMERKTKIKKKLYHLTNEI